MLIHGSPSNGSSQERTSLVMQARPKTFKPDETIFSKETTIRNDFIIEAMSATIKKLQEKGYDIKQDYTRVIGRVDAILISKNGVITTGADPRGDDKASHLYH